MMLSALIRVSTAQTSLILNAKNIFFGFPNDGGVLLVIKGSKTIQVTEEYSYFQTRLSNSFGFFTENFNGTTRPIFINFIHVDSIYSGPFGADIIIKGYSNLSLQNPYASFINLWDPIVEVTVGGVKCVNFDKILYAIRDGSLTALKRRDNTEYCSEDLTYLNTNTSLIALTLATGEAISINEAHIKSSIGTEIVMSNDEVFTLNAAFVGSTDFLAITSDVDYINKPLITVCFANDTATEIVFNDGGKKTHLATESLAAIESSFGRGISRLSELFQYKKPLDDVYPDQRDILLAWDYIIEIHETSYGCEIVVDSHIEKFHVNDTLDEIEIMLAPTFDATLLAIYQQAYVRRFVPVEEFNFTGQYFDISDLYDAFNQDSDEDDFLVFLNGQLQKRSAFTIGSMKINFGSVIGAYNVQVVRHMKVVMPLNCGISGNDAALYTCIDDNATATKPLKQAFLMLATDSQAIDFGLKNIQTPNDVLPFYNGQLQIAGYEASVPAGNINFLFAPNREVMITNTYSELQNLSCALDGDPITCLLNGLYEYKQLVFDEINFTGLEIDLSGSWPAGHTFPSDLSLVTLFFAGQASHNGGEAEDTYSLDQPNKKIVFVNLLSGWDIQIVIYGKKNIDITV
jgi:hypothetical protein